MEVAIKVKGNYCGSIQAEFDLIDDPDSFLIQVTTLHDPILLIDKVATIHGSFSLEQAKKLFKGSSFSNPNPVDIWCMENSNSRLLVNIT